MIGNEFDTAGLTPWWAMNKGAVHLPGRTCPKQMSGSGKKAEIEPPGKSRIEHRSAASDGGPLQMPNASWNVRYWEVWNEMNQ